MGNTWKNKVTKNDVLCKARTTTVYAMLSELRLRWLGHVFQMGIGRIPKHLMYGQMGCGTRFTGCPQLISRTLAKGTNTSCKDIAVDRPSLRHAVKQGISRAEQDRRGQ